MHFYKLFVYLIYSKISLWKVSKDNFDENRGNQFGKTFLNKDILIQYKDHLKIDNLVGIKKE